MTRILSRALKVRPGEGGTVVRILALMFVLFAGLTIGGAATESLYLSRVGPRGLPVLYMVLGPVTLAAMTLMGTILGRGDPRRVLVWPHPLVAAVVAAAWGLVLAEPGWVLPILWIAMMVLWTIGVFAAWGLAGAVHDTRQAKRLFPLYGAGLILGGAVGGGVTQPLAAWLGAGHLLLVWAGSSLVVWGLASRVARNAAAPGSERRRGVGPWRELTEGFRAVRASRLLAAMAGALALFSLLYFALAFLFARAATARFPVEEDLAGFLGAFAAVTSVAALLVSLLVANRLFARFGIVPMVLLLPVIYLAGFTWLVAASTFSVIVAFRAVQMVWVNGVWATGWQALFNVVPADRRPRVRAFMDAVPLQAGIVASGGLLLLADRLLGPGQVAAVGAGAAALAVVATWIARRSYVAALVGSLHEGNPDVFVAEDEPFAGFVRDRAAFRAVVGGARDPDPAVRRMSIEILAAARDPEALPTIEGALRDPDASVRLAATEGIGVVPDAGSVAPAVLPLVRDPDPGVRAAGAAVLARDGSSGADVERALRRLLGDPEPDVRVAAGAALAASDPERLREMLESDRIAERTAVLPHVASAVAGRGSLDPSEAAEHLTAALADPAPVVREGAVDAWVGVGIPGVDRLVAALGEPSTEEAALGALVRIGAPNTPSLRDYARTRAEQAAADGRRWRALERVAGEGAALLADALRHRCFTRGIRALEATAGSDAARRVALENVLSGDPEQRANALEVMDAAADRDVVGPLLEVWDEATSPPDPVRALREALGDEDPLIRASAALAAGPSAPELRTVVEGMSSADPDPLVRETARLLGKGGDMETLATVPLLQRVMFLRKVPLFADLGPADLKSVAEAATEHAFGDGALIAEEGEPGEEMYVVVSGIIRVVRGSDEVARRGQGQCVGEMAVLTGVPRIASLVAEGDVRTLALDRRRFERILRERPEAGLAVMRTLCERLEESHRGEVPA